MFVDEIPRYASCRKSMHRVLCGMYLKNVDMCSHALCMCFPFFVHLFECMVKHVSVIVTPITYLNFYFLYKHSNV